MRRLKYIGFALSLGVLTQCSDYLNVSNPGEMSTEFVTTSVAETKKTLSWAYANYRSGVAAGGNYNFQDPIGSDAEYYDVEMGNGGSNNNNLARLQPSRVNLGVGANLAEICNTLYKVLAHCARVAEAIEAHPDYQADLAAGQATDWTQLYGEAVTLWAQCYFQLTKYWGDVPFGYENTYTEEYELTSRYTIRDEVIDRLKDVEGLMYPVRKTDGVTAEFLSRTYANALIGEISLHSGSWETIRDDMPGLYGDVQFDHKGTTDGKSVYARRKDYQTYLSQAVTYFDKVVNDANVRGDVALVTSDPRPEADNPFQYIWHLINSRQVSPESIWEVSCAPDAGNSELDYGQGRPGANVSAVDARINTFAAIRIIPTFFYTGYEEGDMRRDASMVATGTGAEGKEVLVSFTIGSRVAGGGPSNNKWDKNKGDSPAGGSTNSRAQGKNYTILRLADAMLMLAEAKAVSGTDAAGAVSLVNQIRARAFGNNNHAIGNLSGDALIDAVYNERKLEMLAEGDIRWDMIRSGKFNERATAMRTEMINVVNNLKTNGYHTFSNGLTFSTHVYTKSVFLNGATTYSAGATTGVTYDAPDRNNPILFPGYRGVFDWYGAKGDVANSQKPHNLAIRGLYDRIDAATEAALLADGYAKVPWGSDLVANFEASYLPCLIDGVVGRENNAPLYLAPFPKTIIDLSKGKVTNGYGLPQE